MVGIREWSRFGKISSASWSTQLPLTTIIYYIVAHFITFFRTKNDNTAKWQNSLYIGKFYIIFYNNIILITFHHYFNAKTSFPETTVLFMERKKREY